MKNEARSSSAGVYGGSIYRRYALMVSHLESPFLLLLRLYFGWLFLQTGWGKLHNLAHVTQFFASLSIPFPAVAAPFVASLEFFGGILLILGLGTRLIGLLLAANLFVAYLTADSEALHALFSSDPTKFFSADPFPYFAVSLVVLVFGAGVFSLDYLLYRRLSDRTPATQI